MPAMQFSVTLSPGRTRTSWKVREMPRWLIWFAFS